MSAVETMVPPGANPENSRESRLSREERIAARRRRVQEKLGRARGDGDALGDAADGAGPSGAVDSPRRPREADVDARQASLAGVRQEMQRAILDLRNASAVEEGRRAGLEAAKRTAIHKAVSQEAEQFASAAAAFEAGLPALAAAPGAVPMELAARIQDARARMASLLSAKDGLVSGIHAALREQDEGYVRRLQRNGKEVDALLQLMADQAAEMERCCKRELAGLEARLVEERAALLEQQRAAIGAMLEQRAAAEARLFEGALSAAEARQAGLVELAAGNAESYAVLKARLEGEAAALSQQLALLSASLGVNEDKLRYNRAVLSERGAEHDGVVARQKRRLGRLRAQLARVKAGYAALERRALEANLRLTQEYGALAGRSAALAAKYARFEGGDLAKARGVWAMKCAQLTALAQELSDADAVIAERLLRLPWAPPAGLFEEGGDAGDAAPGAAAAAAADEAEGDSAGAAAQQDAPLPAALRRAVREPGSEPLLRVLCDAAGFLLDKAAMARMEGVVAVAAAAGEDGSSEDDDEEAEASSSGRGGAAAEGGAAAAQRLLHHRAEAVLMALGVTDVASFGALSALLSAGHRPSALPALSAPADGRALSRLSNCTTSSAGEAAASGGGGGGGGVVAPEEAVRRLRAFLREHPPAPSGSSSRGVGGGSGGGGSGGAGGRRGDASRAPGEAERMAYLARLAGVVGDERVETWRALAGWLKQWHALSRGAKELWGKVDALRGETGELRAMLVQALHAARRINAALTEDVEASLRQLGIIQEGGPAPAAGSGGSLLTY